LLFSDTWWFAEEDREEENTKRTYKQEGVNKSFHGGVAERFPKEKSLGTRTKG
jgi:hypothetical protein